MPKRSNDFQRLITFLEKELAPIGATVQESAMLREIDGDDEREVDILIEYEVGNHPIRIALECRDHKRPQGKPWLEEIAGKYVITSYSIHYTKLYDVWNIRLFVGLE